MNIIIYYIGEMKGLPVYVFAIIIIILIVTSVLIWNTNSTIRTLFDGFYSADPVFCEESNLDMLVIYFDHGDGYIMMRGADGTILLNDVFQYKMASQFGINTNISKPITFKIAFGGLDDQDFFPTKQTVEFLPSTQRIKLYDETDQSIRGILYKNNAISDVKGLLDLPADVTKEHNRNSRSDDIPSEKSTGGSCDGDIDEPDTDGITSID